jgi:hypothetical protein
VSGSSVVDRRSIRFEEPVINKIGIVITAIGGS